MKRTPKPVPGDAARLAEVGADLIPLHRYDAVDKHGRQRGKTPLHSDWRNRSYGPGRVLKHMEEGNNAGWRLGPGDLVLDADPRNYPEGRDPLAELVAETGLNLDTCPHVLTGGGGHHYYMTKPPDVALADSLPDFPGVEFKSVGRQVVVAGSVHPSGAMYLWDDMAPHPSDRPPAPTRLIAVARRPRRPAGPEAGTVTPEELAVMLVHLKAEDYGEHGEWLSIMMACHHATGGEGRQEFVDWSAADPTYRDDSWSVGRRWDSLHFSGPGGVVVTARTLFRAVHAAGGGVDVPRESAEDDFAGEPLPDQDDVSATPPAEGTLEEMNRRFAVVSEAGRFRVYSEHEDPAMGRSFFARSTRRDFEDLLANRYIEMAGPNGEPKAVPISQWWLKHGRRRQYDGVLFDPEADHPGWLNMWRGWGVEPKRGNWSLMRKLIRDVLCDGDKDAADYVERWAAHMVQRPSSPAEVALCFRGAKGTGKGTFGRELVALAGRHGLHVSSPAHLTGRFNAHLRDCICLFADEAIGQSPFIKKEQICEEVIL